MKLPDPAYGRGVPTLGREDPGGPLEVSRAAAGAVSARAHLGDTLVKVAGLAETWYEAEEKMKAAKALGEYNAAMSQVVIDLQKNPTRGADEIPTGVSWKNTVGEGAAERFRDSVPTWEVAPQLYDFAEKQARAQAMSQVTHRATREELEIRLGNSGIEGAKQVSALALTGRKHFMEGALELSIQNSLRSGNKEDALWAIDNAVNQGVIDFKDGVKRRIKVENDFANLAFGQLIAETSDPKQLRGIGDQALYNKGVLTDEQAISIFRNATAKADHVEKETLRLREKAERKASSKVLATWTDNIRLKGIFPTRAQLDGLAETMEPTDFRSLVALIDRKDKGEGKNDPAAIVAFNRQLGELTRPDPSDRTWSVDASVEKFRRNLDTALIHGSIDRKSWDQYQQDAKQTVDRVLNADPSYRQAQDAAYTAIAKVPKGSILQPGGDPSRFQVAQEMEIDLQRAKLANPQLDSLGWVQANMPHYQQKADQKISTSLRNLPGVGSFIVSNRSGGLDVSATLANLDEARAKKKISDTTYTRAVNVLISPMQRSYAVPDQ